MRKGSGKGNVASSSGKFYVTSGKFEFVLSATSIREAAINGLIAWAKKLVAPALNSLIMVDQRGNSEVLPDSIMLSLGAIWDDLPEEVRDRIETECMAAEPHA